jgi:membrane protein DedA with SNARE-associated domain
VFGNLTQLVADASGWAYAIVLLLAFLDVFLPVVPSETAVVTAGVVAGAGGLSLPVVIVLAATGAFLGDNTSYLVGHRYGHRVTDRFFSKGKGAERLDWAERQLEERGGELILVGRFIPGGRTVVTLSAGTLHYPWGRFVLFDAVAAVGWAVYAAMLGYVGGRAFEEAPWKGLLLALGIAFAVTGSIELFRWVRGRRKQTKET